MIDIIFYYGTEIVLVRVAGANLLFSSSTFGAYTSTLDGLKLSKAGVIKEFPDLKDSDNWREEALVRLKQKLANMKSEDERATYVIEDLKKYGYVPKWKQKAGFRREVIK